MENKFRIVIDNAKRAARSEIKACEWKKFNYAYGFPQIQITDNIDRVKAPSVEEFEKNYKTKNMPAMLTSCIDDWPAMKEWTLEKLLYRFRNEYFKIGEDDDGNSVKIKLKYFVKYMKDNDDDCPLNVFDSSFCDKPKLRELLADYLPLKYFITDFYRCSHYYRRPPNRWFIIGPRRSGTGIHVDPLGTSAWNALISGLKLWCLFPPKTPGYLIKPKSSEAGTHPDEAITWFKTVFNRCLQNDWPNEYSPVMALQLPGEVMFVPSGWWHVVLNVDDTVAVTENFCDSSNFDRCVRKAYKSRPHFLQHWLDQLRIFHPEFASTRKDFIKSLSRRKAEMESASSTSCSSDGDGGDQSLDDEDYFVVTKKRKVENRSIDESDLPPKYVTQTVSF